MRIQQLKTLLRHLWNIGTQTDRPVYIPTLIWGEAGVGKSEAVKQTVREIFEIDEKDDERLRYHFIDLRIGNMEPSDLIGIPTDQMVYPCPECCAKRASSPSTQSSSMQGTGRKYELADLVWHLHHRHGEVVKGMNGQQILNFIMQEIHQKWEDEISTRTVFSTPDWFPSEGLAPDQREGGFLFLDEINRGSSDTFQAIFQILLDRRLHLHNLPKKWVILAASNPAESKGGNSYVINEDFTQDHALMTRFLHISLEPDNRGWLTYAAKKNLYEPIRLLVGMDPSYLGPITAVLPEQIWPVPRTWSFLNDIFRDLPPSTDESLKEDIATGLIGVIHGNDWIEMRRRSETPLTPTEILDRYQEEAIRDKLRSQIAEKKMGIVGDTITHLSDYLIELYKKSTLSKDQEDNLIAAILDLDIAHAYQFISVVLNHDSRIKMLLASVAINDKIVKLLDRIRIDTANEEEEELPPVIILPGKYRPPIPRQH
jgi:MoxR-like ATPase